MPGANAFEISDIQEDETEAVLTKGLECNNVLTNQGETTIRQAQVLDVAYQRHPERFVRSAPKPPQLPSEVWINKPVSTPKRCLWEVADETEKAGMLWVDRVGDRRC